MTDEWIKKQWYKTCKHTHIYTHNEYYANIGKSKILHFAEMESIMLSEMSQREKDKYQGSSLICSI